MTIFYHFKLNHLASSNYIPMRPRISINFLKWGLKEGFRPHFRKFTKTVSYEVNVGSQSSHLDYRGTFTKYLWVWKGVDFSLKYCLATYWFVFFLYYSCICSMNVTVRRSEAEADEEFHFVIKSPPKSSFIRMMHKFTKPFFNEVTWYEDLIPMLEVVNGNHFSNMWVCFVLIFLNKYFHV